MPGRWVVAGREARLGPFYASLTIKRTCRPDQIRDAIGVLAVPMGTPGWHPTIGVALDGRWTTRRKS